MLGNCLYQNQDFGKGEDKMEVYPTARIFEIKMNARSSPLLGEKAIPLAKKIAKEYPIEMPIKLPKTIKEYTKDNFHYVIGETPYGTSIVAKHMPTGKRFVYDRRAGRWLTEKEHKEKGKRLFAQTKIKKRRR